MDYEKIYGELINDCEEEETKIVMRELIKRNVEFELYIDSKEKKFNFPAEFLAEIRKHNLSTLKNIQTLLELLNVKDDYIED